MKVLEDIGVFADPSPVQREVYDELNTLMESHFEGAFQLARKLLAADGSRHASFCVIWGKAGSKHLPWVMIAKSAGAATTQLKRAREYVRSVSRYGGRDAFFKGMRFAKGTVTANNRRLIFRIQDGTVGKIRLEKAFIRPAKAFKQDGNPAVKKLMVLLREAVVLDESDGEIKGKAGPEANYADLNEEARHELFSDDDFSDLEEVAPQLYEWNVALGQDDRDFEDRARELTSAAVLAAYYRAGDPDRQADLWLEYRAVAPARVEKFAVGKQVSTDSWLDLHMSRLAEAARLRRLALRALEQRDDLLNQLESLALQMEEQGYVGSLDRAYKDFRQAFHGLGEHHDRHHQAYATVLLELERRQARERGTL